MILCRKFTQFRAVIATFNLSTPASTKSNIFAWKVVNKGKMNSMYYKESYNFYTQIVVYKIIYKLQFFVNITTPRPHLYSIITQTVQTLGQFMKYERAEQEKHPPPHQTHVNFPHIRTQAEWVNKG